MKKYSILVYIITILTISTLAEAFNTNVVIDDYIYNESMLSLTVSGTVNGNCGTNVSTAIVQSQATEGLPVLLIEIGNNLANCKITNNSSNKFRLTLDLRSFGIKKNNQYNVMFNNLFSNKKDPNFVVTFPKEATQDSPETEEIVGILKRDSEYNFYIESEAGLYFVKSVINLEDYLNNKVIVNALKIIYHVGPGFGLNSRSPLRENSQNQSTDFVYILGISTI